jgi:hypothetical protein
MTRTSTELGRDGAPRWPALFYTLFESAKLRGEDRNTYVKHLFLAQLAGHQPAAA